MLFSALSPGKPSAKDDMRARHCVILRCANRSQEPISPPAIHVSTSSGAEDHWSYRPCSRIPEVELLKFIGGTIGVIFLIGLLVVIGLLVLIF